MTLRYSQRELRHKVRTLNDIAEHPNIEICVFVCMGFVIIGNAPNVLFVFHITRVLASFVGGAKIADGLVDKVVEPWAPPVGNVLLLGSDR